MRVLKIINHHKTSKVQTLDPDCPGLNPGSAMFKLCVTWVQVQKLHVPFHLENGDSNHTYLTSLL